MRIVAENICAPARDVLASAGHDVITILEACSGLLMGLPAPQDCDACWSRLQPLENLDNCPSLKVIACPCTNVSHLPLEECRRRGIKVLSLRDTDVLPTITATAEHAIGLILALVRKIPAATESARRGEWDRYRFMGREISSLRPAVVGYGRIGKMVQEILESMGCVVDWTGRYEPAFGIQDYDIVTVHVDLNDSTRSMCNAEFFAAMKPGSYFINTSRGQVVDESALLAALRSGHLAGAALDVVCGEPNQINPALIDYARENPERLIITPHIGGCCTEAIEKAEVALAVRLVEEL